MHDIVPKARITAEFDYLSRNFELLTNFGSHYRAYCGSNVVMADIHQIYFASLNLVLVRLLSKINFKPKRKGKTNNELKERIYKDAETGSRRR